ncbi:phosphatase PAP2 family protein [Sphingomonas sp. Leaf17]|uniref:phosphatase PAP2 family protein n=1 Tax=Sphingomonas sp. Leaf17 TaxID=1735683 RepID=UPI0012E174D6|nr:phosphatase PAP2 family protein [Sphingomonas sp. Leaf17]
MPSTIQSVIRPIEHADRRIARAMEARDNPLIRAAGALSEIGDQPPMIALSVATGLVGVVRRDRRMIRVGVRMLAAHAIATWTKQAIKAGIVRTRPATAEKQGYRSDTGKDTDHAMSSFPSGHTAGAVAVAQVVARDYPAAALPVRSAATAVALIQIPRAKHFLSDLVVGAVIALVAERLASMLVDAVDRRIDTVKPVPEGSTRP